MCECSPVVRTDASQASDSGSNPGIRTISHSYRFYTGTDIFKTGARINLNDNMLEIDCSRGEGGGQSVRTSVAMSTVTGKEVHLTRIRENRPTNGLSKQHCTAVQAVADITGSEIIGNSLGSRELTVRPKTDRKYDITMDIGTAGSISLVLQAIQLAASTFDKRLDIDISGGTNVMWAPPIDSYQQVLYPLMSRMGIKASVEILERGFYPEGGGRIKASFEPIHGIKPLMLTDLGELKKVSGVCFSQHLPKWVTEQLLEGCHSVLDDICEPEITIQSSSGGSRGAGLALVAEYENGLLGSNVLSTRGHPAKQAGIDAASDLVQVMDSGSTLDVHTADQLLPYMAMAEGDSAFTVSRISRHLLSQMDTLETFLDVRFGVERKEDLYHFTVTPGGH